MVSSEELLDALVDGVVVVDRDRVIRVWSGAAQNLFGWSAQEAVGKLCDEVIVATDASGTECPDALAPARILATVKAVPEHQFLVTTKSGETRSVSIRCRLLRDGHGRVESWVSLIRDLSRQRHTELDAANFIATIAHDLRSPLTSVKGFASTLLRRWDHLDDETKKQLLLTIDSDADRLSRLIGELVDISRIDTGRLQVHVGPVNVAQLAGEVAAKLQWGAPKHEIEISLPGDFPRVLADGPKITSVIAGLVENALKYSKGGRVLVSGSADERMARISVSDEGPGVDSRQLAGMFLKPAGGTRRSRPSGTGLGLYIARGLVQAQGGRMWIERTLAAGLAFYFELPVFEEPDGGSPGGSPEGSK